MEWVSGDSIRVRLDQSKSCLVCVGYFAEAGEVIFQCGGGLIPN